MTRTYRIHLTPYQSCRDRSLCRQDGTLPVPYTTTSLNRVTGRQPDFARIPDTLQQAIKDALHGHARWPLYVWGQPGVGKTYAGYWLLNHVEDSIRVSLDRLINSVYTLDDWYWRKLHDHDLMLAVIDDIAMRSGDREYITLFRVAEMRANRPVVWLSNVSPDCLQRQYDARVYSRLCCGTVCEVTGQDQRFTLPPEEGLELWAHRT